MPGRKLKLNESIIKIIYEAIRKGLQKKQACMLAGISEETFYRWIKKAESLLDNEKLDKKEALLCLLYESIKKAESELEQRALEVIIKTAEGTQAPRVYIKEVDGIEVEKKIITYQPNWQAAMTLLERRFPNRYSRTTKDHKDESRPPSTLELALLKIASARS